VLGVCSVLVGDRPVGSRDPATVRLVPGDTVEFLPPFAGG
jgi:molybdopterin converting factor small subunit